MTHARIRPDIRYAWCGPAVLIVDNQGRCGEVPLTGFYFRETRYLAELRLQINDGDPFSCSAASAAPHALEFSHIYPTVESRGGGGSGSGGMDSTDGILQRGLDFDLRYEVHPASVEAVLRVTSRWDEQAEFDLAWLLSADYAGIDEAQGRERQQEAAVEAMRGRNAVRFRYTHRELPLETHASIAGAGEWRFDQGGLRARLTLQRQSTAEIRLRVHAVDSECPLDPADEGTREASLREWDDRVARVFAPGETPLVGIANQAMTDLGSMALLDGAEDEWMTPSAGFPLYPAVFGRDALTAGWQAAAFDRGDLVRASLSRLRRLQGTKIDDWRDEEPGRIVQQARRDPLSRLGKNPFDRYYADFASPFMFIMGLGQLYAWSGEKKDLEANWDSARRILDWARESGDRDGDGYLEYLTKSEKGPKHQGWKDSDNAMVHADGSQAEPPVAACEIQGYYYAALQFMAVFSAVMGQKEDSVSLWKEAGSLKERFNRDFWLEDEGYVALGLDRDKRPLRALTSNAGQCLTTGIVAEENLPRLVRRLFQSDLYSGWGLRTLSTQNPAYNPLSYHLGSVWAVENGTVLFGLRRFGFDDQAEELARSIYDLARLWEGDRIPECVGGYARNERAHPGAYPQANAPQAWNRSTFAILIQTLLGMRAVAALQVLALDPVLPAWLPEITLKRLRVGGATVSIRFWRDAEGKSHYEVLEQEGTLKIIRQPPMDSLTVGMWDRLGALVEGVLSR